LEEVTEMFQKALGVALIGSIAIAAVSVFEQIPVLGHLGGALEWVLWGALGFLLVSRAHDRLTQLSSPNLAGLGWGALIGAATAVVGVIVSLIAGLVVSAALQVWAQQNGDPQGAGLVNADAVMSGIGTILSLFYWPFVGAFFCGFGGLVFTAMRIRRPRVGATAFTPGAASPMVFSPDGRWYWDGVRWSPVGGTSAPEPPAWS
jgi:hypothetical protein